MEISLSTENILFKFDLKFVKRIGIYLVNIIHMDRFSPSL